MAANYLIVEAPLPHWSHKPGNLSDSCYRDRGVVSGYDHADCPWWKS